MTTTPTFARSEGLRELLRRLNDQGPDTWRHDQEAADLMSFTIQKYGALARKHGRDPADAAVAAFEVMRTRAGREANDPWAVVTRAVQLTLTYEAKADGLLCSTSRARRPEWAKDREPERFGERETSISEYDPAFWVAPELDFDDAAKDVESPTNAFMAADRVVDIFVSLGWPTDTARAGIEYICARLMIAGCRHTAFEYLRRDRHAQALLDLDQRGWLAMLRAVLGNQHPDRIHTRAGRGLLLLLVTGHPVEELACLTDITGPIARGAQLVARGGSHV